MCFCNKGLFGRLKYSYLYQLSLLVVTGYAGWCHKSFQYLNKIFKILTPHLSSGDVLKVI